LAVVVAAHMVNCMYLVEVLRAAGEQELVVVHNLGAVVLVRAAEMHLLQGLAGLVELVLVVTQTFHTAAEVGLAGFVVLGMLVIDSQEALVQGCSQAHQLSNVVNCKRTGIDHRLELQHGLGMTPSSSFRRQAQPLEHETKDWSCHPF
jgi:hypothetical protein